MNSKEVKSLRYVKINEDKQPLHSLNTTFSKEEVENEENVAILIEEPYVVIDVDDMDNFNIIKKIVTTKGIKCKIMETNRGGHFWFMNLEPLKNVVDKPCFLTIPIDIKSHGKKSMVTVKHKGVWRKWNDVEGVSVLPKWLTPLKTRQKLKGMKEGDGRNSGLFSLIIPMINEGLNKDEIREIFHIINDFVFESPVDSFEIDAMLNDNDIFDNASNMFMRDGKFLHDEFAKWMCRTFKIKYANTSLYLYDRGIYINDCRKVEQLMVEQISELKAHQRREALSYISLIDADTHEPSPNTFCCQNGIYSIEDGRFTDFSPDYFFTSKINAVYNPNARCDDIDTFMNSLFPNNDMRKLIEEMLGYILMNHVKYQKAFILIGAGGNGKSTFLDMVREFAGPINCSALSLEDTSHRFRSAGLVDKILNLGDDISDSILENSSTFKSLVTGDEIVLERKGADPFGYRYKGKMIFTSNSIPSFRDKSEGISRRLVLIPFNKPFTPDSEGYDPHIIDKITTKEARSHLLNIAIRGAERLIKNRKFTDSREVEDMLDKFKSDNNNVIEWLEQKDDIRGIPSKVTYDDYKIWCVDNGLKSQSSKRFYAYIREYTNLDILRKYVDGKTMRVWGDVE